MKGKSGTGGMGAPGQKNQFGGVRDLSPIINTGDRPGTGSGGNLLDAIGNLNQMAGQQQQAAPQQAGGPQTPGMMPWGTAGAMPAGQGPSGPLAGMRPQFQPISNGGGMQSPYGGMPNLTQGYGQQGQTMPQPLPQQDPVNAYHQMIQQRLRRGGY